LNIDGRFRHHARLCPSSYRSVCRSPSRFSLVGGLFQDFAPSFFHLKRVLIPTLQKMGARIELEMVRPGYVPQGQGHIQMTVFPLASFLNPLLMVAPGAVRRIEGAALASHLEREKVAERMARHCQKIMAAEGEKPEIEVLDDQTSVQKGAAFFLRAETEKGCFLGADQAGKPGRRSEAIANLSLHLSWMIFEQGQPPIGTWRIS
jgi:RNA 3'-terminal phosphate cyclase (ATP)